MLAGWGAKVVDQLAKDLSSEFPSMKGFSARNLKYMRKFASEWQDEQIVQQLVAQLPWYHQIENRLFHREGKASNNFAQSLPAIQW